MAAGNFGSPMQLLILLVIILIFFGGSRLRNLGGDLGAAIKGFKNAMGKSEAEKANEQEKLNADPSNNVIDGKVIDSKIDSEKVNINKDQK